MSSSLSLKTWIVRVAGERQWSNEQLMLRYSDSGDPQLLAKLYNACGNDLYHFLLTLSDHTLAKDICQQTWLKVMEKKHLYRESGQFKAWLFTLARHTLIDEYRRQKITEDELLQIAVQEQDTQHRAWLYRFNQALERLPFLQREAFCLQQEDFSIEQIAVITQSSNETVKSRLRYAKDNLREQLKDLGEENHA